MILRTAAVTILLLACVCALPAPSCLDPSVEAEAKFLCRGPISSTCSTTRCNESKVFTCEDRPGSTVTCHWSRVTNKSSTVGRFSILTSAYNFSLFAETHPAADPCSNVYSIDLRDQNGVQVIHKSWIEMPGCSPATSSCWYVSDTYYTDIGSKPTPPGTTVNVAWQRGSPCSTQFSSVVYLQHWQQVSAIPPPANVPSTPPSRPPPSPPSHTPSNAPGAPSNSADPNKIPLWSIVTISICGGIVFAIAIVSAVVIYRRRCDVGRRHQYMSIQEPHAHEA